MAGKSRVSSLELSLACQQLGLMLSCGVHILEGLSALSAGRSAAHPAFSEVRAGIEKGLSLSQSLERQGGFPITFVRSIKAAESSGRLVLTLGQLGQRLGKAHQNRTRLHSALIYPACVLLLSSLMLAFLVYVQVPMFLRFYHQEKASLPLLTEVVLRVSRPEVAVLALATLFGMSLHLTALGRTPEGRTRLRRYLYALPLLGRVFRLADLGQMAREISSLIDSGVDILSILRLLGSKASGQTCYDRLALVADSILAGRTLPEALEQHEVYPTLLISLLKAAEEAGKLEKGFSWYADLAEEEVEYSLQTFLALFEPLMLGFLGMVVTVIILALFLPTYQILMG